MVPELFFLVVFVNLTRGVAFFLGAALRLSGVDEELELELDPELEEEPEEDDDDEPEEEEPEEEEDDPDEEEEPLDEEELGAFLFLVGTALARAALGDAFAAAFGEAFAAAFGVAAFGAAFAAATLCERGRSSDEDSLSSTFGFAG